MKKVWLVSLTLLAYTAIGAEEKVLFDFENYTIGETIPMNDIFNGSNTESRATVVADPINGQNKVLHITNRSWNTTVEFTLDQMTAEEVTGDYQYLAFDLYRPSTDGEYKQFSARIGADTIYADAGFVTQGAAEQWVERSYRMTKVSNTSDKLYMGYNSNDADFISIMCVWYRRILAMIIPMKLRPCVTMPKRAVRKSAWPFLFGVSM